MNLHLPNENTLPLVVRLDDIGASSKRYEIYSRYRWRLGPLGRPMDWLFLKYLPGLRAWGPYKEISANQWHQVMDLLEKHNARLTVGVTAAWADDEHSLIPYHKKFSKAAAALKEACERGLVEIANHGLTHCVIEGNKFKPRLFSGNRLYHREFSSLVPAEAQQDHIERAQDILQDYFNTEVTTFIPPGKNFMEATIVAAESAGLKYISYDVYRIGAVIPVELLLSHIEQAKSRMSIPNNEHIPLELLKEIALYNSVSFGCRMLSLHDRDLVLRGMNWFDDLLTQNSSNEFRLAKDVGFKTEHPATVGNA